MDAGLWDLYFNVCAIFLSGDDKFLHVLWATYSLLWLVRRVDLLCFHLETRDSNQDDTSLRTGHHENLDILRRFHFVR